MIVFLFGLDSYRRQQKFLSLKKHYQEKYPQAEQFFIDLETEPNDWKKLKDFLKQSSIFTNFKLVFIKGATKLKEKNWLEVLKKELKNVYHFLVISDDIFELPKDFKFLIQKPAFHFYFPILSGENWRLFLKKEIQNRSLKFSDAAQKYLENFLASQIDNKSFLAVNLLDQIQLAQWPSPISLENLKTLISYLSSSALWLWSKKFWQARSLGERLVILESLFSLKEEPSHIFNSLAYQKSPSSEINQLAYYDFLIKSGYWEPAEALLALALNEK